MTQEAKDLLTRLEAHRGPMEERLIQEPDDDDLRDMLKDVEEAIELLQAEDGEAPLADLAELEASVAEKLQS